MCNIRTLDDAPANARKQMAVRFKPEYTLLAQEGAFTLKAEDLRRDKLFLAFADMIFIP